MKEFIIAVGLIFFLEGLFLAIFPSKIKNMMEIVKNTSDNKLRFIGTVFNYGVFNNLVYKKLDEAN